MTGRDYLSEMSAAIAEIMGTGDVIAPLIAEKVHAHLLATDPDLLTGWLKVNALRFLTDTIGDQDRHERARMRASSKARAFATAADSGDVSTLSIFTTMRYVIDDQYTRRPVGMMTRTDHLFVAQNYRSEARTARLLASFHEAIASKIGDLTTAEALSEEEYLRLYRSIIRDDQPS